MKVLPPNLLLTKNRVNWQQLRGWGEEEMVSLHPSGNGGEEAPGNERHEMLKAATYELRSLTRGANAPA